MPAPYTPARMVPIGKVPLAPPPSELGPDAIDRGMRAFALRDTFASGSVDNNGQATYQELASWGSAVPRFVTVAISSFATNPAVSGIRPTFVINYAIGPKASFPPIVCQTGGPFTLLATQVSVGIISPGLAAGGARCAAAIVPTDNPSGSTSPGLYINPANVLRNILAAGNATFFLSPYTRQIQVRRTLPGNGFTVTDFGDVYTVAANVEMPFIPANKDFAIQVTNNGAGATTFSVYEEIQP